MSGRIERYDDKQQMAHPDYIVAPEARDDLPLLEPVYPLTAGLSGKILQKATRQALERLPELPEWQEAAWLKARGWPDFSAALQRLHRPTDAERRLDRRHAVAAARLRRAAGRPAGAGPGAAELQDAARALREGRRPRARQARRRAALRAHQLAAPGAAGDRGRHGRAAPHAAAAAGRRRLRQDRGGADGHGDRGGGRRAGGADGADRGAGAPAPGDHRAAGREGGPAHRPADRAREGPRAQGRAGAPRRAARSTS